MDFIQRKPNPTLGSRRGLLRSAAVALTGAVLLSGVLPGVIDLSSASAATTKAPTKAVAVKSAARSAARPATKAPAKSVAKKSGLKRASATRGVAKAALTK